jgi:Site-specific DNA methylase
MLKTIDLFSGAGGLSYGFEATGEFEVAAAIELNTYAQNTYKANHKNDGKIKMMDDMRECDFSKLKEEEEGIDIVIGGPPCQGFSNANRQRNHIISTNNSLIKEFFRAIREIGPKAFVMENVGMLSSETHRFYDSVLDHAEIVEMGLEKVMKENELTISEEEYNDIDIYYALNNNEFEKYCIDDQLLQLLNVFYKNRDNQERKQSYVKKNKRVMMEKIGEYDEGHEVKYPLLSNIKEDFERGEDTVDYEELGKFIKYQKSFRLKKELDENSIIYELKYNEEKKSVSATVKSYPVIEYIRRILDDKYEKQEIELNSLWFGVPQERKRYVIIGVKREVLNGRTLEFKWETDIEPLSVNDAIMDLKRYPTFENCEEDKGIEYNRKDTLTPYAKLMREGAGKIYNHIIPKTGKKAKERFEILKEGENFHKLPERLKDNYANSKRTQNSIYLRLDGKRPSGTVVNVRKSMWIHPKLDRAISVREAARLQSFPDKFVFYGPKDAQYQQVGNAVPPLMAKGIAEKILEYIKE